MPARVDPGVNLFQGARVGRRTEVRIDGIVHVGSVLPPSSLVPIKWIAVGDPAQLISPDQHEEIDKVLGGMQFPRRVYGLERQPSSGVDMDMKEVTEQETSSLTEHHGDKML